jgi:hypothetical protein
VSEREKMLDQNARAALVVAHAARLSAEIAAMQAANAERERKGLAQAYSEEAFTNAIETYAVLHPDRTREYLEGA